MDSKESLKLLGEINVPEKQLVDGLISIYKPYFPGKPEYESFKARKLAHSIYKSEAERMCIPNLVPDIIFDKKETSWGYWVVKNVEDYGRVLSLDDFEVSSIGDPALLSDIRDAYLLMLSITENTKYLPDHNFPRKGYVFPKAKRINIWEIFSSRNIFIAEEGGRVFVDSDCVIPKSEFSVTAPLNLKLQIGMAIKILEDQIGYLGSQLNGCD